VTASLDTRNEPDVAGVGISNFNHSGFSIFFYTSHFLLRSLAKAVTARSGVFESGFERVQEACLD